MALYRSPLTVTLWPSSFLNFTPNAAVLFVDVAIQPEVRFIAKQNSLMKIGNNGNLVLGPFDESTPCLMIVLMNCQTKLRINHLTAVKSVAILKIPIALKNRRADGLMHVKSADAQNPSFVKDVESKEPTQVLTSSSGRSSK
ncbi:adhesion G protein-coupled receptor B2 [Trichonephila clavipes]|nr:adhesion G protein-coupled receptor B2 [Trichonephila clavipes]